MDALEGLVDIHADRAPDARHVQIALRRQFTEGVRRRDIGKPAGNPVEDRIHRTVFQQLLHGADIDAVAGEDPEVSPAALIEIIVVGKREMLNRRHLKVRRHEGQGIAGGNPVEIPGRTALDAQDHFRLQPVLCPDMPHAAFGQDIDAAAVRAQQLFTVEALGQGENARHDHLILRAVARRHAAAADDAHPVGLRGEDRSVLTFADRADLV